MIFAFDPNQQCYKEVVVYIACAKREGYCQTVQKISVCIYRLISFLFAHHGSFIIGSEISIKVIAKPQ